MARIDDYLKNATGHAHALKRPFVTLSYAQSLDGSIAITRSRPVGLSSKAALKLTHQLRARHRAILVGIGTILSDDPQLNVRYAEGPDPIPVILDTDLRIPLSSRVLTRKKNLPWVFCRPDADPEKVGQLEKRGARIFPAHPGVNGRLDLSEIVSTLYENEVQTLMIEGGAAIITDFLKMRLVDICVITLTPVWIGGVHSVEELVGEQDGHWPALTDVEYETCGDDLVIWGRLGEKRL